MEKVSVNQFVGSFIKHAFHSEHLKDIVSKCLEDQGLKYANGDKFDIVKKPSHIYKEGDWLTDGRLTLLVVSADEESGNYVFVNDCGSYRYPFETVDDPYSPFRPWSIDDAKEGDVLRLKYNNLDCTFIFKSFGGDGMISAFCHYWWNDDECYNLQRLIVRTEPFFQFPSFRNDGIVTPATNAEKVALMEAMDKEDMYWDSVAKEVKKKKVVKLSEFESELEEFARSIAKKGGMDFKDAADMSGFLMWKKKLLKAAGEELAKAPSKS